MFTALRSKKEPHADKCDLEFLRNMSASDRLIWALREVEKAGQLPLQHFKELYDTTCRLGVMDFHKSAYSGVCEINRHQDAIIENLKASVIKDTPYLVLDVGAHDGWFVKRIMSGEMSKHKVISFEPNPSMLPVLRELQLHHTNLDIVPKAIGHQAAELELLVYEQVDGLSSLMEFTKDYHYLGSWFDSERKKAVKVQVISLDEYERESELLREASHVCLKIDVQGYEWNVLQGSQQLLQSGRVKAILIELTTVEKYVGAKGYLEILVYLQGMGFELLDLNPFYREIDGVFQELPQGKLTEFDCLLVHHTAIQQQKKTSI